MKDESIIEQKARELEGRLVHPTRAMPQYQQAAIQSRIDALRWVLEENERDSILGYGAPQ